MNVIWEHMTVVKCISVEIRREVFVVIRNAVLILKLWIQQRVNAFQQIAHLDTRQNLMVIAKVF